MAASGLTLSEEENNLLVDDDDDRVTEIPSSIKDETKCSLLQLPGKKVNNLSMKYKIEVLICFRITG